MLTIPTPRGNRGFVVGGIFDDLNSIQSMFIEHEQYARIWGDQKVDRFGVMVEDGASISAVEERLDAVVAVEGIPAEVATQEEAVGDILDTVEGLFSLARGIQLAALVVAALTIANTMLTSVLERRWETGLQRAIGMDRKQVGRTLLLEATGMGLVGGAGATLVGTGIGVLMTRLMEAQYSWRVPFELPIALIAAAVVGGIVIATLAGLAPSRAAVRAPIIESLRYE